MEAANKPSHPARLLLAGVNRSRPGFANPCLPVVEAFRASPLDPMKWAILTGQYGQTGGVSDYTALVAEELAIAGDDVTVYASSPSLAQLAERRFSVVELPGSFGPPAHRALDLAFKSSMPDRVLVQYAPHAFGWRGMNVPFALWLHARRNRYPIWIMYHEVAVDFRRRPPFRHNIHALMTHIMAWLTARSASRIFIAALGWERTLRPMIPGGKQIIWTPIPSNIPVVEDPDGVANLRRRNRGDSAFMVGHVGTYGWWIKDLLAQALMVLLDRRSDTTVMLLGANGQEFRDNFIARRSDLADRIYASGALPAADVSRHLQACDIMIQPYPDGVTTRRGSAMMILAHGLPLVTNSGHLTENVWREHRAVHMTPAGNSMQLALHVNRLLNEQEEMKRLAAAGKALYEERFALRHTITALRDQSPDLVQV